MMFNIRSKLRLIFFTLLFLLPMTTLLASEMEKLFVKGNEYYQNGDYKTAIAEYRNIKELGYESWEVYYNLGNAYYKDQQIAKAILNYERAIKLDPKNEDVNFNLDLANLSVIDQISELPLFFIFKWISNIARIFSMNMLGIVVLSIYLLLITLLIIRFFIKSNRVQGISIATIIITSIVFLFFSGIFLMRIYTNETKVEAIILVDKVDVKSAPGDAGTDVFTLHTGIKVQIQDSSNEWVKIKLADGKVGWLRDDNIESI